MTDNKDLTISPSEWETADYRLTSCRKKLQESQGDWSEEETKGGKTPPETHTSRERTKK
jgi:hypothetical protein